MVRIGAAVAGITSVTTSSGMCVCVSGVSGELS